MINKADNENYKVDFRTGKITKKRASKSIAPKPEPENNNWYTKWINIILLYFFYVKMSERINDAYLE